MQYKRIFIPFSKDYNSINNEEINHRYECAIPVETEESTIADKEILEHLNNGWKIVSTVASTASEINIDSNNPNFPIVTPFTYTNGIEVFLIKE
jgi:hypothetical protein